MDNCVHVGCVALTLHAELRARRRGISRALIPYIMDYGKRSYRDGGDRYLLRRKDIDGLDRKRLSKYAGITVVVSHQNGQVITVMWTS